MHVQSRFSLERVICIEPSFRDWCDEQLWPQELLKLLEVINSNSPYTSSLATHSLKEVLRYAARCKPDIAAVNAALNSGNLLYVTSAWGELSFGQTIASSDDLPAVEPFSLRLVSFPSFDSSHSTEVSEDASSNLHGYTEFIQDSEVLPPLAALVPSVMLLIPCA